MLADCGMARVMREQEQILGNLMTTPPRGISPQGNILDDLKTESLNGHKASNELNKNINVDRDGIH